MEAPASCLPRYGKTPAVTRPGQRGSRCALEKGRGKPHLSQEEGASFSAPQRDPRRAPGPVGRGAGSGRGLPGRLQPREAAGQRQHPAPSTLPAPCRLAALPTRCAQAQPAGDAPLPPGSARLGAPSSLLSFFFFNC